MHLYTSSRMWLTAHMPTNWAVTEWLFPLRHPKSMWTIVQLLSNYLSQICTYIKLPKGVTYCAHLNNLCVHNWDFWSCSNLVRKRMPVQQHPPIRSSQALHLKDFCPGKISMKKKKSCPVKSRCMCIPNLLQESSYHTLTYCWTFRAQILRVKMLYILRWISSATDQCGKKTKHTGK